MPENCNETKSQDGTVIKFKNGNFIKILHCDVAKTRGNRAKLYRDKRGDMILKVKVRKLNNNAVIPTHGSEYAAGYDLYAGCENKDALKEVTVIEPHGMVKIHTGLAMEIPEGYFGAIFARSGMATKQGLRPANCVGVIDSDYRGEIIVALRNDSDSEQIITSGERIAQIVIMPYLPIEFEEVESLGDTERGNGGFGSTGLN